ncbi:hypothetical protein CYMTET_25582 [Cymbomonas tetramitiformis]|uniref:Uncharacterized protein n=1 Tax=Cymbomonas tetramitiformis TaxID=36881 RepID=A0AAE0FV24_9CHLO|nr:hypothetical protein CYMTET_25582 [Cymbomonas tetramitiformis]
MARIRELGQRERHPVFHGEGGSHDPIFFREGGDEAPVAGAEPEEAHEAHGGREEPDQQTQAGVVSGIFGHTPEDPRVGTKRVRALQEALMSAMAKSPVLGVGIYPAWTRAPAKAYCRRGTREGEPLVEGPNVENPTADATESAQDLDQSHHGTEVGEPEENHQEQMLLEELQHAHWDPSSSPGQWDHDNQEWETPRSHATQGAAQETTRDEWDMLWEFEEAQGPPRDQPGDRDADETPHPPHAPLLVQGEHSGVTPEGTQPWDPHDMDAEVAMSSQDRELLQAIEEAESTDDPIVGLCRSMMRRRLWDSVESIAAETADSNGRYYRRVQAHAHVVVDALHKLTRKCPPGHISVGIPAIIATL